MWLGGGGGSSNGRAVLGAFLGGALLALAGGQGRARCAIYQFGFGSFLEEKRARQLWYVVQVLGQNLAVYFALRNLGI